LYIGHPAPKNAPGKLMQHILFHNPTTTNNAIFALCFVASGQVLRNDEINPAWNLDYCSDGNFERLKVTIV
jgi:hypothetical protein